MQFHRESEQSPSTMAEPTSTSVSTSTRRKEGGTTLSGVLGFVGKVAAVGIVLVAVVIALLPRLIYTSLPPNLSLNLEKPTTLIVTGANSGLGLATVQNFAHNEKATIIMACRSMTRCENAKQQIYNNLGRDVVKAKLRPMLLDISHKSSVEAFAKELQGQPIDILINNAGMAGTSKELQYHEEDGGVESHIRVNHLGPVYLTHCLWKNLQLADHARVVAVSSVLASSKSAIPTFGWYKGEERFTKSWNIRMYGCSKRANLFFVNELHHRYKDKTTISVTAAHPGWTHTELCKKGCKGQNNAGRFIANLSFLTGSVKMAPEVGSLSQAYAAVLPQAGVYVGPSLLAVGEPKILGKLDGSRHHASFTRDESRALWDKSMEAMGITVFGDYEIPVEKKDSSSSSESEESSSSSSSSSDSDSSDDAEEDEAWNTYLGDGKYKTGVVL